MLKLEDVENKKQALQDFFVWIFDDNRINDKSITLYDEVDFSLCSSYNDPNIYYPTQIKNFFETKPMKRLNRISQLGLVINASPNSYHTRLEHSKGTYYRKVEELFYNFQDSSWREYIEKNNLKLVLIAELIKVAGHDIGHAPLSHALEEQVIGKRGAHEEIGKRIMLENKEIQSVLSSISPSLISILENLYENDVLNFKQHDESNYDVDRLDFLVRDSLYAGSAENLPTQIYKTTPINCDDNGNPIINSDNSISEASMSNHFIDVYDYSSLPEILKALKLHNNHYKKIYISNIVRVFESCLKNFLSAFLLSDCDSETDLKKFLSNLKNTKISNLDLDEFLEWDEITFYSHLLDIAENSENPNMKELATIIIPNMSEFLTLIYSLLNMYDNSHTYSDTDKQFLERIRKIIKSNSTFSNNLKDKNYICDKIIFVPLDTPFLDTREKSLLNTYSLKLKTYKNSDPIYVRDKFGKIYELSKHPDIKDTSIFESYELHSSFANIPFLKFNGVDNDIIEKLKAFYKTNFFSTDLTNKKPAMNLQPLQVGHKMEDTFLNFDR